MIAVECTPRLGDRGWHFLVTLTNQGSTEIRRLTGLFELPGELRALDLPRISLPRLAAGAVHETVVVLQGDEGEHEGTLQLSGKTSAGQLLKLRVPIAFRCLEFTEAAGSRVDAQPNVSTEGASEPDVAAEGSHRELGLAVVVNSLGTDLRDGGAVSVEDMPAIGDRVAAGGALANGPVSVGDMQSLGDAQPRRSGSSLGAGSGSLGAPGYEVEAVVGSGGMGVVYRARQLSLGGRLVAIKRLHSSAATASARKRFLQEAALVATLQHPHIVAIYELAEDQHGPFIVQEYVGGGSLLDLLQREASLSERETLWLMLDVCRGVAHAHARGVLHRDLKPGNILLTEGDRIPKVVDFGLARAVDGAGLSIVGQMLGTPFYMAPEQGRNASSVDERADVYSLGKTLYHLVTGHVPDTVDLEEVSPGLARILRLTLKRRPGERYQNVPALMQAMELLLQTRR